MQGQDREEDRRVSRHAAEGDRDRVEDALAQVDMGQATGILEELIAFESTWEHEGPLAHHLERRFRQWGFPDVTLVNFPADRPSVVARIPGTGAGKSLMLNGHLDIYEIAADWTLDPWTLTRRDGKLHGAGIADMKSGTAACIAAAKFILDERIPLKGDLLLACVGAHFEGGVGTRALVTSGVRPDGAIVAEPSFMKVVVAQRGTAYLDITTKGRQSHSSAPEKGINAIYKMSRVLEALRDLELDYEPHPLLGESHIMNVGTIRGGTRYSQVPDRCTVSVDFRFLPSQSALGVKEKVQEMIAALSAEDSEFDAEVGFNEHWLWGPRIPYEVNDSWEILRTVGRATEVALGAPAEHVGMMAWTDMAVLGQAGTEAVNIGPGGSPLNFADEYVLESEFEGAIRTYVSAAIDYCNQPP
jgi:acetylornithine deacetylase/succinyl-diaminopimelate desuccinylase-like protein